MTSTTTTNAGFAAGVTTLALNSATKVAIGDTFTVATDSTNTAHRIVSLAGTNIGITPALTETLAGATHALTESSAVVNFGLITSDSTSATYRVTSTTGTGSHLNKIIVAPQVTLSPSGLETAGSNTMSFAAATATGTAMDTNTTALTTAKTVEEYSLTVGTKFNGIVDVENGNTQYTTSDSYGGGGTAAKTRDKAVFTLAESAGTAGTNTVTGLTAGGGVTAVTATTTAAVMTIDGSWDYLDDTTAAGVALNAADVRYHANGNDTQKANVTNSVPATGANAGKLVFTSATAEILQATAQSISISNGQNTT
jgi:hypothetical protein